MDAKLEFSDAQVISCASASAIISDNEFVLGTVKDTWGSTITNDVGAGHNGLVCNFQIATALNASAQLVCKLYTHTASAATSGTAIAEQTFAAEATAGTRKVIRIPLETTNKWFCTEYSVVGSNMTTGAVDAWIGLDTEVVSK